MEKLFELLDGISTIIGIVVGAISTIIGTYLFLRKKIKKEVEDTTKIEKATQLASELENFKSSVETRFKDQEKEIHTWDEKTKEIEMQNKFLKEKLSETQEWIQEENKEIKQTLKENTKAISSLDGTMSGLKELLTIFINKLDTIQK